MSAPTRLSRRHHRAPARVPRPLVAAAALLVAGSLGACGGGSGSASPDASTSGTPAPTASSTSAGPPPAAPATGTRLVVDHASMRLPRAYHLTQTQVSFSKAGAGPGPRDLISLGDFPTPTRGTSLRVLARVLIHDDLYGHGRRLRPVVVDGVRMAHVAGVDGGDYTEVYSAPVEDAIPTLVSVDFTFDARSATADRRAVVQAVLASFRWTA